MTLLISSLGTFFRVIPRHIDFLYRGQDKTKCLHNFTPKNGVQPAMHDAKKLPTACARRMGQLD